MKVKFRIAANTFYMEKVPLYTKSMILSYITGIIHDKRQVLDRMGESEDNE